MKDTAFHKHKTIKVDGKLIVFNKPLTMGIVNITTDSFYSGSRVSGKNQLLSKVEKHLLDGADIIDLGAYSTRPGAEDVHQNEEEINLLEAIELITKRFPDIILSIDTFRAEVARKAIESGAHIINDIGGGNLDDNMFDVVAELGVPYILMHSRGTPQTMKSLSHYDDVVNDVIKDLSVKINKLEDLGVSDIIVDPGFGFAKTIDKNFEMLKRLKEFELFGLPLLVGISRKSMIWKTLETTPENALNGTTVLNTLGLLNGGDILRVHDVKEAVETIKIMERYYA